MELIKRFWKDEEGPTMAEYALMLALVAVVALGMAYFLGTAVRDRFNDVGGSIANPPGP